MEKKKQTIYAGISLLALALLVVGATYAYFQNQYGESSQTDVKVTTYTTDLLTFETGDPINITADQESFAQGKGNQTGSSFAKAILQANSKTNVATANYYIYLNIESNEFIYTSEDNKAELVLQVNDNSGNPVTNIDGLTYVTVTDGNGNTIKGFDITEKSGLINLVNNKEISASPRTEEQYNITLIFVNYNHDQYENAGYNFNAKLIIQKDGFYLANYVLSQYTGIQGENNIYYHDSSLENGANDNSYRYAGASDAVNNYVCFGSDEANCPVDNLYRIIGIFDGRAKLIKADYATSTLLGTDGDYKGIYSYKMPTIDNNVDYSYYKGSLTPESIIGVYWNYNGLSDHTGDNYYGSNIWSTSLLNKTNLNTNYLNNIGSKWTNMIDTTTWKVGGNTSANIYSQIPSVAYQNEIVNPASSTTYEAKIGLMYVSDYGFAASLNSWSNTLTNYSKVSKENWLFLGLYEHLLTRDNIDSTSVFGLDKKGNVGSGMPINAFAVRPTFYLNSSINYSSGDGTKTNPIRITN